MFPTFLVQALFPLGAAFLVLCATIFHYFSNKVEDYTNERLKVLILESNSSGFFQKVIDGSVPSVVVKDFLGSFLRIGEPRRILRHTLLASSLVGVLFIISASLASLISTGSSLVSFIANEVEFVTWFVFLAAIVLALYCALCMTKMARLLA